MRARQYVATYPYKRRPGAYSMPYAAGPSHYGGYGYGQPQVQHAFSGPYDTMAAYFAKTPTWVQWGAFVGVGALIARCVMGCPFAALQKSKKKARRNRRRNGRRR